MRVNACSSIGVTKRLNAACIISSLDGKMISRSQYNDLRELFGYLGANYSEEAEGNYYFDIGGSPVIGYDNNFNGGNPDKPLILNGVEFSGDPALQRKSSSTYGVIINSDAIVFWGKERGVSLKLVGRRDYSNQLKETKDFSLISLCSENRLYGGAYLDACLSSSRSKRSLSSNQTETKSVEIGYLFGNLSETMSTQSSVRLENLRFDTGSNNQLAFRQELALRNGNNFWFQTSKATGNDSNRLTLHRSQSFGHAGRIYDFGYSAQYSRTNLSGLVIFGFDVNQKVDQLTLTIYPIDNVSIALSQQRTSSNLSYYSEDVYNFSFAYEF